MNRGEPTNIFSSVWKGLTNVFDPNNPLMPYLVILDLALLLLHVYLVYWVYRDSLQRYNRGAPWALLAAIFPVGGWLFYLLYRSSPLVEFDRIDADTFEDEFEWTDYDQYKANQSAKFFNELTSLWRKEASGYSPWVRASRARELKKKLTPEEMKALRAQKIEERTKRLELGKEQAAKRREDKQQKRQESKERQTMSGAHGFTFKLSDKRQRKLRQKLALIEKLKLLPREDSHLEDLIYQMQYAEALAGARASLSVAEELQNKQGVITYGHYIDKLTRLVDDNV